MLGVGLWGHQRCGGTYGVFEGRNTSGVGVGVGVGEGGRKGCPLTLLPFAEFQYNNHIHSATQNIPFLLDTGQIPRMVFEQDQHWSHVESINKFKERMEDKPESHLNQKLAETASTFQV